MKKFILVAAVMLFAWSGKAAAESNFSFDPSLLHVSTFNISTTEIRLFDGAGYIVGVQFSTGACGDFVTFKDTDSTVNSVSALERVYNVNMTTNTYAASQLNGLCSGAVRLPTPIPFRIGATALANVSTYNTLKVYWWKRPQQ